MVPAGRSVVDVGADHGHLAARLGAIATEKKPHIPKNRAVPWVITDGLQAFRSVDVAIIAGMGARTIAAILDAGPQPAMVIAHSDDEPWTLRCWLAAHGWRIDAERLALQSGRFCELIRAVRGEESAEGVDLELGPRLLDGEDPLLQPWASASLQRWSHLAKVSTADATRSEQFNARANRLSALCVARSWT
jgi:tRNA (adenine22-N1)-methyltransferase